MEKMKIVIENTLKAIRHCGNKALSGRGVVLRESFGFIQRDCNAFACNDRRAFTLDSRSALPSRQLGFTLAEILIVLTIIGVMAVMTIPSLMQNANSQHKIAMFKKAFNAVSNAYATEFATKTPPQNGVGISKPLFNVLKNQLNVKYYYDTTTNQKVFEPDLNNITRYWIVAEDGIAYKPSCWGCTDSFPCTSKLVVNSQKTETKARQASCGEIFVDIDGPEKGTNQDCVDGDDLSNLNCDGITLFVTTEGITSGNSDCVIAGRILSDTQTRPSSCNSQ